MTKTIDRFNPPNMAQPFTRYSQAVEIPSNARTLIIGGQVGVRIDGSMSDEMAEQTSQCFRNIEIILRAKNMELDLKSAKYSRKLIRESVAGKMHDKDSSVLNEIIKKINK